MSEVTASAPGKFVIMGEHAVVYGKPAIALAIDRRFTLRVNRSGEFKINGEPADINCNPHMKYISDRNDSVPVSVYMDSRIPAGSGLGSSAALSAAFSIAMRSMSGKKMDQTSIAAESFEAEYSAQGRGSPMDTSASTHGYGIGLNLPQKEGDHLWNIRKNNYSWDISKVDVPKMTFVIGYTGIRAPTGPLVEKVRKYKDSNKFASDIVDEIGYATLEGKDAIDRNDVVRLGKLMTYNHKLLSILGVSCNELNKLVNASLPYSYGAKLTGSGGGGCMVALTDDSKAVAEAISARGGVPYIVSTGVEGARIHKKNA